jgi:hypothetical protein
VSRRWMDLAFTLSIKTVYYLPPACTNSRGFLPLRKTLFLTYDEHSLVDSRIVTGKPIQ